MTETDQSIKRDAYGIAAQLLACEVRQRRRRHTPYDVREIAVTVHIDELVQALREISTAEREEEPEDKRPQPDSNGHARPRRTHKVRRSRR